MELVYQPFVEDWDADVRREAAEMEPFDIQLEFDLT